MEILQCAEVFIGKGNYSAAREYLQLQGVVVPRTIGRQVHLGRTTMVTSGKR
jgi:hypothetical protein